MTAIARERVAAGRVQVALVNSGNANACTGRAGLEAALSSSQAVATRARPRPGAGRTSVDGRDQSALAREQDRGSRPALAAKLTGDGAGDFSRAIMTTDKAPKLAFRKVAIAGTEVKPARHRQGRRHDPSEHGHPARVRVHGRGRAACAAAGPLAPRRDQSFNAATVDGETSTNDMILTLASGASGALLSEGTSAQASFERAPGEVLKELAEQIVADGEGAEHVAEVPVSGTVSDLDARRIAQRSATSLLVKTAMHGKDANWGRILCAAGVAGVAFDPERAVISIDDVTIVAMGSGSGPPRRPPHSRSWPARATASVFRWAPGRASYLTCDIGHGYIDVNAGYRS